MAGICIVQAVENTHASAIEKCEFRGAKSTSLTRNILIATRCVLHADVVFEEVGGLASEAVGGVEIEVAVIDSHSHAVAKNGEFIFFQAGLAHLGGGIALKTSSTAVLK
jgi:hypothetical protein